MSTRREDTSSDKQRFSSDDADARQEGSSPDQRASEQEAFRAPPKVAPKFAREYVGTESPAARLMRLAQGLAGKRSEQAKKPPADDQRSAPPPHSAPPKFNPKFAKEFIGTPPQRAEQASSSTPPPPPKPPNTPPPFDPRFSSEYVGNRSPFAAKGQAAGPAAPPPPPPPPPPATPPPKVDAKYAKETIVRPSPFTAAGASAKPSPKPAQPASAQARPTAKAATGAKPPPPPRQAPPPRPPAASVPPPKVEAKYAKESINARASSGGFEKPPRDARQAAGSGANASPGKDTRQKTAGAGAGAVHPYSAWASMVPKNISLKVGEEISLAEFTGRLFAGIQTPIAVLVIDNHAFEFGSGQQSARKSRREPKKSNKIRALIGAFKEYNPAIDVSVWARAPESGFRSDLVDFLDWELLRGRTYDEVFGVGEPHDRHIVISHAGGIRHWHATNSVFGFITKRGSNLPTRIHWKGNAAFFIDEVEKLPFYAAALQEYRIALKV